MSDTEKMSERDELAAIIDAAINEEYDPGDDVMGSDLAPAILVAGYGKKASAWDEGYMACLLQVRAGMPARNPYTPDELGPAK